MLFLNFLKDSRVLYSREQMRKTVVVWGNSSLAMLLVVFVVFVGFTDRTTQASQKQPASSQRKIDYLDLQKFDNRYNTRAPSLLTREWFRQALERDPEVFLAHQKLALLLAASPDDQVRDGKQALQAAKLLPERKAANLALIAIAYAELKQFDKAKQYNRDAIKSEEEALSFEETLVRSLRRS